MNGRRTGTGHASGKVTLVGSAFQPQPAYLAFIEKNTAL